MEFTFAIFAENCNFVEIAFVASQFPLKILQLHRFNPTPLNVFFMFITCCALLLSIFGEIHRLNVANAKPIEKSPTELRMEEQGLVDITTVVPGIHVSLMYARSDNFVGRVMYRDLHRAYLLPETAEALKKAQTALQKAHPELSLKVYDATRPISVQQQMWNMVAGTSKSIYVSNPKNGGGLHNYGLAVDITLCWRYDLRTAQGKLLHTAGDTIGLSMGTPIDYLGKMAHVRDETAHFQRGWLSKAHLERRKRLRNAMEAAGFKVLPTEWWHFNFKTRAQAKSYYKIVR